MFSVLSVIQTLTHVDRKENFILRAFVYLEWSVGGHIPLLCAVAAQAANLFIASL